jgi:hypothetical protein
MYKMRGHLEDRAQQQNDCERYGTGHRVDPSPLPAHVPTAEARCFAWQEDTVDKSKHVKPDDINVVVSVNERSERDLIRHFDKVRVD